MGILLVPHPQYQRHNHFSPCQLMSFGFGIFFKNQTHEEKHWDQEHHGPSENWALVGCLGYTWGCSTFLAQDPEQAGELLALPREFGGAALVPGPSEKHCSPALPLQPQSSSPPSPSSADREEKGGRKLCLPMAWAGGDRGDIAKQ